MEKRLKLARNLLKDSGYIHLNDDNEFSQTQNMCDEVFGGQNLFSFVWKKKEWCKWSKNLDLSTTNIFYVIKKVDKANFIGIEKDLSNYKNSDNDREEFGCRWFDCGKTKDERPNFYYEHMDWKREKLIKLIRIGCGYLKRKNVKGDKRGKVLFPKKDGGSLI